MRNAGWSALVELNGPRVGLLLTGVVAMGLLVLTLFTRQEISGEAWGYWFFARVFAETGDFVALDRSPLYSLYLNGFRWIGYPTSVTAEHLVTGLVVISGIVAIFRSYLGLGLAIFVALLWFPYLQFAEPPVQQLALSCSLWGLVVRRSVGGHTGPSASYALFIAAYMFRSSYLVLILLFVAWDLYRITRHGQWRRVRQTVTSMRFQGLSVLPLVVVAGLLIWFSVKESDHPWNNPQSSTTTWFPTGSSRSLGDAHFIQAWNWRYIEREYGTFVDKDWYFTNQELFDGAGNVLDAVRANPSFVFGLMAGNIKPAITTVAKFTEFRYLPFLRTWDVLLLVAILAALWAVARDADLRIFIAASIVILAVSASALPGTRRHMVALVPLLVLCASWYGNLLRGFLDLRSPRLRNMFLWTGILGLGLSLLYYALRATFAPQPGPRTLYAVLVGIGIALPFLSIGIYRPAVVSDGLRQRLWLGSFVMLIPLVLFSSGISKWTVLIGNVIGDYQQATMRVLESERSRSMKASFDELKPLIGGCKGIMSLEHIFLGAFMDVPMDRLYDVWEIPPFGQLGESEYDGLRPDRIDCVLVSDHFATTIGMATNAQLRYDNYVEPYVEQLKEMGAAVYDIERYGQAIVLEDSG